MASSEGPGSADKSACNTDLLLHPELLSKEFILQILNEKKIDAGECEGIDGLRSLYLRHVMPLPQRTLPNTRWGRRVERTRGRHTSDHQSNRSTENYSRKRPQVVYDGSSHLNSVKVRKTGSAAVATGCTDRLKPPPTTLVSNPIRKLSSPSSSSSSTSSSSPCTLSSLSGTQTANPKRDSGNMGGLNSPEMKKKIHHVTWP